MRIELEMFNLRIDKLKERIAHFIDFEDDYIVYHIEAFIDEAPLKEEGEFETKEDILLYYYLVAPRYNLQAVDMGYSTQGTDDEYDYWWVELSIQAMASRTIIKFETKEKAIFVRDIALRYLLKLPL